MDTVGITDKKTQALVNGLINIWNWALALTSAFSAVDRSSESLQSVFS